MYNSQLNLTVIAVELTHVLSVSGPATLDAPSSVVFGWGAPIVWYICVVYIHLSYQPITCKMWTHPSALYKPTGEFSAVKFLCWLCFQVWGDVMQLRPYKCVYSLIFYSIILLSSYLHLYVFEVYFLWLYHVYFGVQWGFFNFYLWYSSQVVFLFILTDYCIFLYYFWTLFLPMHKYTILM